MLERIFTPRNLPAIPELAANSLLCVSADMPHASAEKICTMPAPEAEPIWQVEIEQALALRGLESVTAISTGGRLGLGFSDHLNRLRQSATDLDLPTPLISISVPSLPAGMTRIPHMLTFFVKPMISERIVWEPIELDKAKRWLGSDLLPDQTEVEHYLPDIILIRRYLREQRLQPRSLPADIGRALAAGRCLSASLYMQYFDSFRDYINDSTGS